MISINPISYRRLLPSVVIGDDVTTPPSLTLRELVEPDTDLAPSRAVEHQGAGAGDTIGTGDGIGRACSLKVAVVSNPSPVTM